MCNDDTKADDTKTDDTKNNKKGKFSDKEIFKIALAARDFEIKMFWQRCNYFLLLNTSVGAAAAVVLINENVRWFILFLCPIGMFVCWAWIKVGLGAKFWQVYWEQVVANFQKRTGLVSSEENEKKKDIFSDYDAIKWRVKEAFKDKPGCYSASVLKKPSVSRWMHRTACFFFGVWSLFFLFSLLYCIFLILIHYYHHYHH